MNALSGQYNGAAMAASGAWNAGSPTCDPIETSPARNQISGAETWLSDLHAAIDRLEQRLDTILTPVPPDVNKVNASTPTSPKSHVVGRLELLNEGFAHLSGRIERLKGRVEL